MQKWLGRIGCRNGIFENIILQGGVEMAGVAVVSPQGAMKREASTGVHIARMPLLTAFFLRSVLPIAWKAEGAPNHLLNSK